MHAHTNAFNDSSFFVDSREAQKESEKENEWVSSSSTRAPLFMLRPSSLLVTNITKLREKEKKGDKRRRRRRRIRQEKKKKKRRVCTVSERLSLSKSYSATCSPLRTSLLLPSLPLPRANTRSEEGPSLSLAGRGTHAAQVSAASSSFLVDLK